MSMAISARRLHDAEILDLAGRITIGEGTLMLRDKIQNMLDVCQTKFLLNLADVAYIDNSGLGELVSPFTTVKNQGGALKLVSLTHRVHALMQITKLLTVFNVYDDEPEALKSFL